MPMVYNFLIILFTIKTCIHCISILSSTGKPQMIKLVHAVNTVGKSVPVSVVSAVSGAIRAVLKADASSQLLLHMLLI